MDENAENTSETQAEIIGDAVSEAVVTIVEEQQQQEAQAEIVNRALIEGMIESERTRMLSQIQGEIEACRARLEPLEMLMPDLSTNLASILTRLEAQELTIAALIAASSIPPVSSPSQNEADEAEPVQVQAESLPEPEPEKPTESRPPAKKKRRIFL